MNISQVVTGDHNIFTATGDIYQVHQHLSPADTQTRYELRLLLDKVKSFWVAGFLERSTYAMHMLELGKELHAEVVDHPWETILELPGLKQQSLQAGTTACQIFDQYGYTLLILGEAGSGKTITLLELARDLLSSSKQITWAPSPFPWY